MADTDFSDWITALNNLQDSVSADLEEIRKQKAEVQQLREEVYEVVARGRYVRNDQRLILSAPEIVIGNVDNEGMLFPEGGSVVIRGQQVGLEGVGTGGIVSSRASTISEVAVDPGPDGIEDVVHNQSVIIHQARHVAIQANDAEKDGFFYQTPRMTGPVGVSIHADQSLELDASVSSDLRSQAIADQLESLGDAISIYTSDSNSALKTVSSLVSDLEDLLGQQEDLMTDEETMRSTVMDLDDLTEQFNALMPSVYSALNQAISSMSLLAEANRRQKALQNEQTKISSASETFKDETTGAVLSMTAEIMDIASIDGDGNIRTNPEASISVQTGKINIQTKKDDGSLIDDSYVKIATHDVDISTVNSTLKEDGTGDYDTVGSVHVSSKNVSFSAVDYSTDAIKSQTAGSSFSVRAENMTFLSFDNDSNSTGQFVVQTEKTSLSSHDKEGSTTGSLTISAKDMQLDALDKEGTAIGNLMIKAENMTLSSADKTGKAIGQFSLNSKDVFVKSMDADDKGADKNLAAGGNMVLVAENMFVGRTDKDNTSKTLQISSDKTGIYGTTTAEMQQGEAKAVVQLDGGKVAIGGSKAEFFGDNTVNGKTDFKGDVTAPKLTADNLEAKTSFKSKDISDGVAVPGAPSSAKISAKLTEQDAPKPKAPESEGNEK